MKSSQFAIVPTRMWDGESDSIRSNAAVIITHGIVVGIMSECDLSQEIPKVRMPGCTLIPGFIDAHVHYTAVARLSFLLAGVTTVRDTGNGLSWILKEKEKSKQTPYSPRIYCCGILHDGGKYWNHIAKQFSDEKSLRTSIRNHVKRGVDQIKLYADLPPHLFRVAVDEAHRHGKSVLAHLGKTSPEAAIAAGLDEIEHFDGCVVAQTRAPAKDIRTFVDLLCKHKVKTVPTLVVWDRLGRSLDLALRFDSRLELVHPILRQIWSRWRSRKQSPEHRLRSQDLLPPVKRFTLSAHKAGILIGAGSDTPFINLIPGFSLHDEILHLMDSGLKPVDALKSATSVNAIIIGAKGKLGCIRAGAHADLLAIEGNPLKRLEELTNIRAIWRNGIRLDMDFMRQQLLQAKHKRCDDPIIKDISTYK